MCKIKVIGKMDHTIDNTLESANRVYSDDGIAPTIPIATGDHCPKVLFGLNDKKSNNGTQYYQQDRVYSSDGIAMCHPANIPGGSYKYMIEGGNRQPLIVAMRGREDGQQLEAPKEVSHTLTSVQKDNLVIEGINTKGKQIDCASTILAGYERTNMTDFNADNGVMEKVKIKQATEKGYTECEVGGVADFSFASSETRRGRVQGQGQISPTLTCAGIEGIRKIEKVGQISSDGSQCGTVISDKGLCSTLSAGTHGYGNNHIISEYRIRKLTPKECWRLMGFTDEEFEKAAEVNSNTQLYKQAGNSIVVDVLVAIFKELLY